MRERKGLTGCCGATVSQGHQRDKGNAADSLWAAQPSPEQPQCMRGTNVCLLQLPRKIAAQALSR